MTKRQSKKIFVYPDGTLGDKAHIHWSTPVCVTYSGDHYAAQVRHWQTMDVVIGALMVCAELAGWDDAILSFPFGKVEIRKA